MLTFDESFASRPIPAPQKSKVALVSLGFASLSLSLSFSSSLMLLLHVGPPSISLLLSACLLTCSPSLSISPPPLTLSVPVSFSPSFLFYLSPVWAWAGVYTSLVGDAKRETVSRYLARVPAHPAYSQHQHRWSPQGETRKRRNGRGNTNNCSRKDRIFWY